MIPKLGRFVTTLREVNMKRETIWKRVNRPMILLSLLAVNASPNAGADLIARKVTQDLSKLPTPRDALWKTATEESVMLMAQPMIAPRPDTTHTSSVKVQTIHDGKWIAFRLRWKDTEKSEAGRLGLFSDAVAIEFPVKDNKTPPPIFMGAKDDPVHLFHWRAQYQADHERGKPEMKDLYPNMSTDMYPLEFKDYGSLKGFTDAQREVYSHGRAAGNPQSYAKRGVDEMVSEGYSTSSVIQHTQSEGAGEWKDGEWAVVISRALSREGGSVLKVGEASFLGFAVWQGGHTEVGSRKCVTMTWTPLQIKE